MWLYFLSGVLTLLIQKLCNSRIFPAQHLHPGLHNSRRKERSLSLKRAGRRAQTDKCLHTLCTDTHTNTSASAHWEAYPPPSSFASHSLARSCNRDSYIRRIFSGPRLLQRGKTSLCHNASHDHTSPELNVWERSRLMTCILNQILPLLLNGFYLLRVLHVCVYELAVGCWNDGYWWRVSFGGSAAVSKADYCSDETHWGADEEGKAQLCHG